MLYNKKKLIKGFKRLDFLSEQMTTALLRLDMVQSPNRVMEEIKPNVDNETPEFVLMRTREDVIKVSKLIYLIIS